MSDTSPTTPNTTTTTTQTPTSKTYSVREKTKLIAAAWQLYAPETKFAGMTQADYVAATADFEAKCKAVEDIKIRKAGIVVEKNNADAKTVKILNAVVSGIKADPDFGPDSGFYRACGYVTSSERSAPTPKVAGSTPAKRPAISLFDRYNLVCSAWANYAPEGKFGGMSIAEFKYQCAQSVATREQNAFTKLQQAGAIGDRDKAEPAIRKLNNRIIGALIADPDHGKSSPFWGAIGYKVTPA